VWTFAFFIAPGPLTFDLFAHGFDWRMVLWLATVMIGTGIAGLRGRLPGAEPKPSIIYFTEDLPNPFYRRLCYTVAWSEVIAFAVLGESVERRYFYSAVWAVAVAQPTLWILWKYLPPTRSADAVKLVVFVGIMSSIAWLSYFGRLPRTRLIVADH
jgi:hypothetical protein